MKIIEKIQDCSADFNKHTTFNFSRNNVFECMVRLIDFLDFLDFYVQRLSKYGTLNRYLFHENFTTVRLMEQTFNRVYRVGRIHFYLFILLLLTNNTLSAFN